MLYQVKSYIKHTKEAKSFDRNSLSTQITELIDCVFDKKREYYAFKQIELLRENLKLNNENINVLDLGAGSKKKNKSIRKVKDIVKNSSKPKKYGQLLFRLANYLEINNAIELGTSFGISTLYIKKARRKADVYTIEGSKNILKIAENNFKYLKENIKTIEGNIDYALPSLLKKIEKIDFVFLDGNHKYEATLNYFNLLLQKIHNKTIFVLDDIYWSEEMTKAWNEIKENKKVTTTIDIFEMGIVFFNPKLKKQNIILKY